MSSDPLRDGVAAVMELADITDLKSVGFLTRTGSSPVSGREVDGWKAVSFFVFR